MNYKKVYQDLVNKAKLRGHNKAQLSGYFESHHITPKCLGGDNSKDNLVLFTAREHVIAHKLLWKSYPDNHSLMWAYKRTVNSHSGILTSREVEKARNSVADYMSKRVVTQETKEKIRKTLTGHKRSQESIEKGRTSQIGQKRSEETKAKLNEAWDRRKERGWTHDASSRAKISIAGKGRKLSEETKNKMSKARKGKPPSNTCRDAGSEYQKSLMPWERSTVKFNKERLHKWVFADYYQELWEFSGKLKCQRFRTFVNNLQNSEFSLDYFTTIIDMFFAGWIPEEDPQWTSRFRGDVNV
jgi:hypothetical protein